MLDLSAARVISCAIHYVGSKHAEEGVELSQNLVPVDNLRIQNALLKYFLGSFKGEETYRLAYDPEVADNPVFMAAESIFNDSDTLMEQSANLAEFMYTCTDHPNAKGCEMFVCLFSNCYHQGQEVDAVGIYRMENKELFMQLDSLNRDFFVRCEEGVSLQKLERGCLIFKKEESQGFAVSIIDNVRSGDAQFWKTNFLKVKPAEDNYNFTTNVLKATRDYITREMPDEFPMSKTDTMEILNRSLTYFQENDSFDKDHFAETVFVDERMIDSYRKYDEDYSRFHDAPTADTFEIHGNAVKKQAKIFKSVLKLDKNFHIYIHGNREKIEKGVEADGRKYYKIYFEEEA